ncbi:hypothetical protein [Novosphingobium album (ex Liu et al. 2023)]|uniref:DGQHR domain-containing protein n=1 Tax=Novosphingobium album (ex Liu et al. 2023) TaxID=3031130 RepID=A0ABT5WVF2_9SPHN|nr:hypothetical protein [Novosphingobium album (ex Liu et al. 2023)]MDE8653895.1 hypothetical protein [Novosphingobium album (ex Liu et al. 2023)]
MKNGVDLPEAALEASDRLFVFKETEHPEGGTPRNFSFTSADVAPLGYEDLAAAQLHKSISIPLEIMGARIVETDVDGMDKSKPVRIRARLESPFTSRAIGLVRGGWLPPTLAATRKSAVILTDRNIIAMITGRFKDGRPVRREPDFIDLFEDEPVRINPSLSVIEGNSRAIPDPSSVRDQYAEVIVKVANALPRARLMVGPGSIQGIVGLIEDTRPTLVREKALLRRFASVLGAPVALSNRDARWREVITAADELGVRRNALVVLAMLSAIVNPRGYCAAKKVLKLNADYSDGDAYNALSDLRSLKLLMYCFACYPEENTQLCTQDRHLAHFWVGIGASDFRLVGKGLRCSMTPHEAILPGPYCQRWMADIAAGADQSV